MSNNDDNNEILVSSPSATASLKERYSDEVSSPSITVPLTGRYNDELRDMTYGRRVARFFSKYKWYYDVPTTAATGAEDHGEEGRKIPSLDAGWEYFEHYTLGRRFQKEAECFKAYSGKDLHNYVKAEDGEAEEPTALFAVLKTPELYLGEYGIGVSMYFYTLRCLYIILFIAFFINIPLLHYYTDEYHGNDFVSNGDDDVDRIEMTRKSWNLMGSAVCTDSTWEPCPTCKAEDWTSFPSTNMRYAEASLPNRTNKSLKFIKVNHCIISNLGGYTAMVSIIFVCVSILALQQLASRRAKAIDKDTLSLSDYSIVIKNPPANAHDEQEWKDFFETQLNNSYKVSCVTIAVQNMELIDYLEQRRRLLIQLMNLQPSTSEGGVDFFPNKQDNNGNEDGNNFNRKLEDAVKVARPLARYEKYLLFQSDALTLQKKLEIISKKIDDLIKVINEKNDGDEKNDEVLASPLSQTQGQQKERSSKPYYDVSYVFITFEKTSNQLNVLNTLGRIPTCQQINHNNSIIKRNDDDDITVDENSMIKKNYLFRNKYILNVEKPEENDCIRWKELRKPGRLILSITSTAILIALSCSIVTYIGRNVGTLAAATATSIFNAIAPRLCLQITKMFEYYDNEGGRQSSDYYKVVACKWIITVVLLDAVTPFTNKIGYRRKDLIITINYLFTTEAIKNVLIGLSDIYGNYKRHWLAPRCTADQRRMNLYFIGSHYELYERYAEITKTLFLCLYYALLYPAGFLWASLTLLSNYWVDKFCLLRVWKQGPELGTKIGKLSRDVFFTLALAFYAYMAATQFSSFPYDNACEVEDEEVPRQYYGSYNASLLPDQENNTKSFNINITSNEDDIEGNPKVYKYCKQDMLGKFSFTKRIPPGAERLGINRSFSGAFDWVFNVVFLSVAIVLIIYGLKILKRYFISRNEYNTHKDNVENFNDLPDIGAYVPQIQIKGMLYPTLLCDVSNLDENFITFSDPDDPFFTSHNIIYDIPELTSKNVFSTVKYWDPKPKSEIDNNVNTQEHVGIY